MSKKHSTLLLFSFFYIWVNAQQFTIKPGEVYDSIPVVGAGESYSIFLPKGFKQQGKWPILLVYNLQGKSTDQLRKLTTLADREGYMLAASHQVSDSLSITDNVLVTGRMIESIKALFPIHLGRVYTYGRGINARFANLVPVLLKDVEGVISDGAGLANQQLISTKNPFHFVGIIKPTDFSYPIMTLDVELLNRLKFRNQLLLEEIVDSVDQEKEHEATLGRALRMLTLASMRDQYTPRDTAYINQSFVEANGQVQRLYAKGKAQRALQWIAAWKVSFTSLNKNQDWSEQEKEWKKSKLFRSQKREEQGAFFKEEILKEDYIYYLQEDMEVTNFNNLGWWNSQLADIAEFLKSSNVREQEMGYRLKSFVNALLDDNLELMETEKNAKEFDETLYLWMLKTLTLPDSPKAYLKVASLSSYREDYGTALFYLEELLKTGYEDRASLYQLEDTALLRITPEFNALIDRYFDKGSRYQPK